MKRTLPIFSLFFIACGLPASAAITGVTETNLGGDAAAIIAGPFGEDALTFSDRDHQHNGAAFSGGVLSTTGVDIVGLPDYLIGNEYIRFANNARENAGYTAEVTTDIPSKFYLLLDNRINGPAGDTSSPNTTDPDLGGTFQWVIDGGWVRVNTGISPDGQADYTGVDEGGESVGPGVGLNQFYSIWELPAAATSVTVANNGAGGSNMISLVAAPELNPEKPISSFGALPNTISEGEASSLSWFIHEGATVATIDNGIGDILPETVMGAGEEMVSPGVTTTYTLSVESPDGDATAEATVTVRLINSFGADLSVVDPGDDLVLTWDTRSDATVTISGVGEVAAGSGSVTVNPTESTTYILTASAGAESEMAEVEVFVMPAGALYALLDIGALDGTPEAGALTGAQIGAGVSNTNGTDLPPTDLTSETGDSFSIAIDNIDPLGAAVGGLDWRDRGDSTGERWTALGEDHVKNNGGMIRVTLGGLEAGVYDVISWHFDPTFSQCESIVISTTDANGVAVDTGQIGSAAANPTVSSIDNTTENMVGHAVQFSIESNGVDDVIIYFDGQLAADMEVPLDGLRLSLAGGIEPLRIVGITVDEVADSVSIEFTSRVGRTYSLYASPDLKSFVDELDDSIEGEEGTTTFVDFGVDTSVTLRKYYRVSQN
ncbi:MAG: hypothetical protein ACR2RV_18275 [Verrucomicrobiales bacterium]